MLATQIITGIRSRPSNVFLTPDLKPFYAGGFFPPNDDPAKFFADLREANAWTASETRACCQS
jgi:uncharacterized protein YyaL (SSP411 family)